MKTATSSNGTVKSRVLWAVVSVVAALIFWVYYTANYGTSITRTFYGVEVTYSGEEALRDSLSLVISGDPTSTVNVTLSGSRREISKLTSSDLKAVVNLSGVTRASYRSMSYTLSYPSSVNTSDIQVVSQSPQTINLQISKLSTKTVDLSGSFQGTLADGYAINPDKMTFDPAYITIIGPEEELEQIAAAKVVVSRDNVSAAFTATANFSLVDSEGTALDFDDIQCDAESVTVTVPVNLIKEVSLDVTLVSGGGATADNVIKNISPQTITLAGDAATLEGINTLSLATIDLSDYVVFSTTDYNIVLPNGVECLSGETTATVELEFTGLASSLFTVTNLDYTNLTEGYTASIMTANMIVTIRGPEDVLELVTANNIRAVADLTGVTTTSSVPVTIYVDGYEDVGAVGDYTMYVQVKAEE